MDEGTGRVDIFPIVGGLEFLDNNLAALQLGLECRLRLSSFGRDIEKILVIALLGFNPGFGQSDVPFPSLHCFRLGFGGSGDAAQQTEQNEKEQKPRNPHGKLLGEASAMRTVEAMDTDQIMPRRQHITY